MAVDVVAEASEQQVAVVVAVEGVDEGRVTAEGFDADHCLDIAIAVVRDDAGAQVRDRALRSPLLEEADPVADAVEAFPIVGTAVEMIDAAVAAHQVVVGAAVQRVVAETAPQVVVAALAEEDVVAGNREVDVAEIAQEG